MPFLSTIQETRRNLTSLPAIPRHKIFPLVAGGSGQAIACKDCRPSSPYITDAAIAKTDRPRSEARPYRGHSRVHCEMPRPVFLPFVRRPGLGRRALRRTARVFLRLLTSPP